MLNTIMDFKEWLKLNEMPMFNPQTLGDQKFVIVDQRKEDYIPIILYKSKSLKDKIGTCNLVQCPRGTKYWTCHQSVAEWYVGAGYGPFLYDLAIEYATMHGNGIVPATGFDCGMNSEFSDKVWRKYYEKRPDVEKHSITDALGKNKNHWIESEYRSNEPNSKPWLYTCYSKPPIFWHQLLKDGRLEIVDANHPLKQLMQQREREDQDKWEVKRKKQEQERAAKWAARQSGYTHSLSATG
jgi:hypothetical protein